MRTKLTEVLARFSSTRRLHGTIAYYSLYAVAAGLAVSNALFSIALFIFLASAALSVIETRNVGGLKNKFSLLLFIFIVANGLSIVQSSHWAASAEGLFKVCRSAAIALMVIYVLDTEEKIKNLYIALLIIAVVIAVDGLFQRVTGYDLLRFKKTTPYIQESGGRLTGPFNHANDYAAFLSLHIFLFIGFLRDTHRFVSRKMSAVVYGGFLLLAYNLLQTYSRGAWFAVALAALGYIVFRRSKLLIACVLLGSLLGFLFGPPLIRERALSSLNFKNNTIIERKELWKESLRMISLRPWFGFGINTYSKNEPNFKSAEGIKINPDHQYAHNGYLQMASEIGLVGLFSFLMILVYYFLLSIVWLSKKKESVSAIMGWSILFGLLSFLLHSATDTNLQSFRLVNMMWLYVGIGMAVIFCYRNKTAP